MNENLKQSLIDLFQNQLADKLEELYPKGVSKERSQALVFNAYAVIIFKKILDEELS